MSINEKLSCEIKIRISTGNALKEILNCILDGLEFILIIFVSEREEVYTRRRINVDRVETDSV